MTAALDLRSIARALGGEVSGTQVRAPGPQHSAADRSLSVTLDDKADGGFIVHSFAAAPTLPIYFCEGEKDADNLAKLGFVATTASEGAEAKWAPELTKWFEGRHIYILPDNDAPGRKHAEKVARALDSVAASVRIV